VNILRIKNDEIYNDIENVLLQISNFVPSPERGGVGRGFPIVALTATATPKVRQDMVERL
jgi:hypothetical protein